LPKGGDMLIDMRPGNPTFAEVEELVDLGIEEAPGLDYKEKLPGRASNDHKEFWKDVCAFANASGGWLVYGVSEQRDDAGRTTGVPKGIVGVGNVNADTEKLRLHNLVHSGVAPRVDVAVFVAPAADSAKTCVLLWVPPSTYPPCMVVAGGDSRFWLRRGGGKYSMDIDEIRRAFVEADTWLDRLRAMHEERAKAAASGWPVPGLRLPLGGGRLVMHVAPLRPVARGRLDVVSACRKHPVMPMHQFNLATRVNIDGFVRCSVDDKGESTSYVQVLRSGVVETVDCRAFKGRGHWDWGDRQIFEEEFLEQVAGLLKDQLLLMQELAAAPPYVCMVSLLGVGGWWFAYSDKRGGRFDRDEITLPEVMLEDESGIAEALQETDQMLWQAAGLDRRPMPGG